MAYVSTFSTRRAVKAPSARDNAEIIRSDWRGLDLTNPYEAMKENRSPFARNFRMYAEEAESRRVSISNRKGAGFYSVPVGEAQDNANDDLTGAADNNVGALTEWKAAPFMADSTGRLSKIELRMKSYDTSRGAVIVTIHEDDSGAPGEVLATSGIENADIGTSVAWVPVRFIEAPLLTDGETYWIVLHIQDDGSGVYSWRSNTLDSDALTSDNGGLTWTPTAYSLNWKSYFSTDTRIKGMARYAPSNGANKTIFAVGTALYQADDLTGAVSTIATGLSASATEYFFTFGDDKLFWANGYDDLKTWDGSTVDTITHAQLPILKNLVFHKNVLWGLDADDPNKLVFSVPPVEDDGSGNEWYNGWLSTNFGYVPAPKASDPITGFVPFQDSLVVFTAKTKWVIYGSNSADLSPREATGKKGATHQNGIYADDNYVYFQGDDGFYRWNGAEDLQISELIQPEFDRIGNPLNTFITKWKRGVRFYYNVSGSAYNNRCAIWHNNFEEWMIDTDAFVSHAVAETDADDDGYLIEASSFYTALYHAEQHDHNLGKPIDFQYYCRPEGMDNPAKKKRIVKYIPLLEGEGGTYPIHIAMDKDLRDDAVYTDFQINTVGVRVGDGSVVGSDTLVGTQNRFDPKRLRMSGYAYYWQTRIKREAINNPVNFMGYVLSYREKRL